MKKGFRFVSMKTKMQFMFLIVISVPVVTMVINSYLSSEQMLERKYTDLLSDISMQANIRIEELLDEAHKVSLVSSYGSNSYISVSAQENYPIQNYLHDDSKINENQAVQLLMNNITMIDSAYSIYLYNMNGGKNLYVSLDKPIDFTYFPDEEIWFTTFLKSDNITTTIPTLIDQQTRWEQNWAMLHLRKIFDMSNGDLLGVIVISMNIEFIDKLNQRLQEDSRSSFTVVSEDNVILYNSNYDLLGQNFDEVFSINTTQLSPKGDREIVKIDGEDYIFVHTPLEHYPWTSYLFMAAKELAVEGNMLKRNLFFIVIGIVIFTIISSFYLTHLITRPIKGLMRNMLLVEKGEFENLPKVKSNDEIGLLAARFEQMSYELKQLVERIYQEERDKTDAEIRALQAQINPHFLYNTLNSLKWIASIQRSHKIVDMTEALISLLRYSYQMGSRMVTIKEELHYIEHYFTIQKVRYFNKFLVEYDIDNTLTDTMIPRMSMQPIVENAIFHGIADLDYEGVITIEVKLLSEQKVGIIISDNGNGMSEEAIAQLRKQIQGSVQSERGIGVRNVHYRIQYSFGREYGLEFMSKPNEGSKFVIGIPRSK